MTCPFTVNVGVYSIGVLGASERAALDQHLATCARCRAELAQLQGLPRLLSAVRAAGLDVTAERRDPPVDLLDRTLRAATAERRRSRSRRILMAAAGVVALLATAGVVADSGPLGGTPQPPSATRPAGPAGPVATKTTILAVAGGAQIDMTLTGIPVYTWCRLVVHARDGSDQTVSSWQVTYSSAVQVHVTTGIASEDITWLDVVDSDNRPLVTVPADTAEKKPGH